MLPILAVVALIPQAQFTTKLAGKDVKWSYARVAIPEISPEVKTWDGWGNLQRAEAGLPYQFPRYTGGTGSDLVPSHAAVTAATPAWKLKVVIFTRSDIMDRDLNGVLVTRRTTIEPFQLDEILKGIARFGGLVENQSQGLLRIDFHVEIDSEPMKSDRFASETFGSDFASSYFEPRINGPGFVSEDGVYRGPFNSVIYIHPGFTNPEGANTIVNGTQVSGISVTTAENLTDLSDLDSLLFDTWRLQVRRSVTDRTGNVEPQFPGWPLIVKTSEWSAAEEVQFQKRAAGDESLLSAVRQLGRSHGPSTRNIQLSIKTDAERGDVLSYVESGFTRVGGVSLPVRASASAGPDTYLSFWVKGSSRDPISLRLHSADSSMFVSLGKNKTDRMRLGDVTADFSPNGKWQRVVVKLSSGDAGASGLNLGPPPGTGARERLGMGNIEFAFDDFEVSASPPTELSKLVLEPTADLSSQGDYEVAMALAKLNEDAAKADIDAATRLIASPVESIRINAVDVFTRVKSVSSEPALIEATRNLSPRVSQLAVRALAHQGTDVSKAAVRRALEVGPYDSTRAEAAFQVGKWNDPATAGALSTVIVRGSRVAKLASISAIAALPGDTADLVLLAFLGQEDPEIRAAVVRTANVAIPQSRRQLLYTAVNDSSDQVRALSYIRLFESLDAKTRAESSRGVRDDGINVRLMLIEWMGLAKKEDHRGALQVGLADTNSAVRAAALRALSMLPKGVLAEEAAPLLNDESPAVQIALLELASSKKIELPGELLAKLRSSPVNRVRELANP